MTEDPYVIYTIIARYPAERKQEHGPKAEDNLLLCELYGIFLISLR
jgi:hypothetical protein